MNIMRVVITGGIATGKSTASKIFEDHGFKIIDADKIAHKELENAKDEIVKKFGRCILSDTHIDRKKLGAIIFGDKDKKRELEEILHPKIKADIEQEEKNLQQKNQKYIIDIPLFFETGNYKADTIIVVYATKDIQLNRLLKRDGLSKEEAIKRIESQIDIEKKRALADIVIDNSGDIEDLKNEVKNAIFKI